jgi:hypothetical protein
MPALPRLFLPLLPLLLPGNFRYRRALLARCLILLVLLVPALGQMHAVLHPATGAPLYLAHGVAAAAPVDAVHAKASGDLAGFFEHRNALDCFEFAQLACAHDLPVFAWQPQPPAPPSSPTQQGIAAVFAAPYPAFAARAPPVSGAI